MTRTGRRGLPLRAFGAMLALPALVAAAPPSPGAAAAAAVAPVSPRAAALAAVGPAAPATAAAAAAPSSPVAAGRAESAAVARRTAAAPGPPPLVYSVLRFGKAGASSSAVVRLDPRTRRTTTLASSSRAALSAEAWPAAMSRVFYFLSTDTVTDVLSVPQGGGAARREVVGAESADVSRDGRRIVFTRGEGVRENLFVLDRTTRAVRRLTGAGGFAPRFSPDGRRVVFSRYLSNSRGGEQAELYTLGVDGRGLRRLTARTDTQDVLGVFSPDGKRLLFSRGSGTGGSGGWSVLSVGLDGRGLRLVRSGALAPDWAANGWLTYLLVARPDDPGRVVVRSPGVPGTERVLTPVRDVLTAVRFLR